MVLENIILDDEGTEADAPAEGGDEAAPEAPAEGGDDSSDEGENNDA